MDFLDSERPLLHSPCAAVDAAVLVAPGVGADVAVAGLAISPGVSAPPVLPVLPETMAPRAAIQRADVFINPILAAPAADPWVIQHDGLWYSVAAFAGVVDLRVSSRLSDLGRAEPIPIWRAPAWGPYSCNLWAPEMHWLDGRWFIYLAADDGRNENHRMWVFEAESPFGPWHHRGMLQTGGWAIDGTVLEENGRRYFIWSGWPGKRNGVQNLYIAEMSNPWTLAGRRVLLAEPTEPWERRALPLCEGPQLLRRNGRTFLVYSASGSWTPDYCLGMLINDNGNFLDRGSWTKQGPVFQKTERVWGVGHCCFAQDPLAGDLIFYHAKTEQTHGWDDRNVRVQPFGWSADGVPEFGEPVAL